MKELAPGSGIYVYETDMNTCLNKQSASSKATFLVNCFYTKDELIGMNLTGVNGKRKMDRSICEAIICKLIVATYMCDTVILLKYFRVLNFCSY